MYKILIAEDEISSRQYIENIVGFECSGYEIIGSAEDGAQALELLGELKPDVLITDIRMPVMNGLDLIIQAKERYPDVRSIIISGYSEFEYAQRAIKAGAVDYLLKPINVREFVKIMDKIREDLDRIKWENQIQIWYDLLNNQQIPYDRIQNNFSCGKFKAALIRKGGLPKRFSHSAAGKTPEYDIDGRSIADKFPVSGEVWILAGRDENEIIIIMGQSSKTGITDLINSYIQKYAEGRYCTAIYSSSYTEMQEMYSAFVHFYNALNETSTIGKTQIRMFNKIQIHKTVYTDTDISALIKKLERSLGNGDYKTLKNEFVKAFGKWEKEERTELWLEGALRNVLSTVAKFSPVSIRDRAVDYVQALGVSLHCANSFGELMADVWDAIELLLDRDSNKAVHQDAESMLDSIDQYLENHYSEQLSLQNMCTIYGISQTYLSRIFRKYKQTTFNDYLTKIRMEKAKQFMEEDPGIKLKEVSTLVGYVDPSYFSKVFRTYTGVPPSGYAR